MSRPPIQVDGPYSREPRIYTFLNWFMGGLLAAVILAILVGVI